MGGKLTRSVWGAAALAFLIGVVRAAGAQEVPRVTVEELKVLIGDPAVVVDVRVGGSWERSQKKISGAVRADPKGSLAWADKYKKDATIVLYCT